MLTVKKTERWVFSVKYSTAKRRFIRVKRVGKYSNARYLDIADFLLYVAEQEALGEDCVVATVDAASVEPYAQLLEAHGERSCAENIRLLLPTRQLSMVQTLRRWRLLWMQWHLEMRAIK